MALGSRYVHYEKDAGIAWLRLDRPESRNALTKEMYGAIARACMEGDADPDVQVTVLTGTGDVFCPGGDLRGAAGFMEDPEQSSGDIHALDLMSSGGAVWEVDPFLAVQNADKLVIAAVNGICQAGGFIMAMLADITIASERATFRIPELLRGVADPYVSTRLPLYVGMERAKYLMLTCETISAGQAFEWGLLSEVVPHDDLIDRTRVLAEKLLLTGPEARAAYKRGANRLMLAPDYDAFQTSIRSDECREGFAAFKEKRAPAWVPHGQVMGRL